MFSKYRILLTGVLSASLVLALTSSGDAETPDWLGRGIRAVRAPFSFGKPQEQPVRLPTASHVDYDAFLSSQGQPQPAPTQFVTPDDTYAARDLYSTQDVYSTRDAYYDPSATADPGGPTWQLLPEGLIYENYLAGTQEPRMALHLMDINSDGFYFAGFLGSRVPLLRYGSTNPIRPEGFQVDAEGVSHVRIDFSDNWEVDAADFRGGLMSSFGHGRHRTKFGYYHLSSHVQDEFLLANPGFNRLNFSRDVLVLGHSYYLGERVRIYGEVGYAFISDVSQPWEVQFGLDYAPCGPTGIHGAPFFAINGHLREEVNFGGSLTTQLGWAWVGETGKMLRMGLHFFNGESNQYSFFDDFERQIGFGIWYDI